MIRLNNVSKSYGGIRAVIDASLQILPGEYFSLLGESGSGKTSLLRMIGGFESVDSGEIFIDGMPVNGVPPHHRPVNTVFQSYAIFPHLNVRDNIAYGLRRLGLPRASQNAMVEEMLDLIALQGYGSRRANQLSGGQKQRVALARALILKPKVLLLDEPLAALDKQSRERMQLELRKLQQKLNITFLHVTHDQQEAMSLSDRIGVMEGGTILQVDTPSVLYDRPANRRVAAFVGHMNFFDATCRIRGGDMMLDIDGIGSFPVPGMAAMRKDGEPVLAAIRPENVALTSSQVPGALQASLATRRSFGSHELLHVSLSGRSDPITVAVQGNSSSAGLSEGKPLWLSLKAEKIIILERGS